MSIIILGAVNCFDKFRWILVQINVCWLIPLALLAACTEIDGFMLMLLAYAPLLLLAWHLRAGQPEIAG